MSELIAHASPGTLLVTHLDNAQLARVAELMDAPAICLVDGAHPGSALLEAARRAGAAVMVSASGLAKTVRALEELLRP
jgi:threonine dehydrogenase-like Zn-dependent dehydrogenase